MNLNDIAKADIRKISTDLNGWGKALSFIAPTGETADIVGLHTKIHMGFDTEGNRANVTKIHVSFSEALLTELGYPVRNDTGSIFLNRHKVTVADDTGTLITYVVEEFYPDETIGLIVCILGKLEV